MILAHEASSELLNLNYCGILFAFLAGDNRFVADEWVK